MAIVTWRIACYYCSVGKNLSALDVPAASRAQPKGIIMIQKAKTRTILFACALTGAALALSACSGAV